MAKIYIYIFTNISNCPEKGFSYIGISKDPDKRCQQHLATKSLIGNKLRKYDFDFDILDVAESYEEAFELEKAYIEEVNTQWPNGYNVHSGGKGGGGKIRSEVTRSKISIIWKGRKWSNQQGKNNNSCKPEVIKKLRERLQDHEIREKRLEGMRKSLTTETRMKMSKSKVGKNNPMVKHKGESWEEIIGYSTSFVRKMNRATKRLERKFSKEAA